MKNALLTLISSLVLIIVEGATLRQLNDRFQSVINCFQQKNLHGNIKDIVSKLYQIVLYYHTVEIFFETIFCRQSDELNFFKFYTSSN